MPTVAHLKAALAALSQPTGGRKAELVARLAVAQQQQEQQEQQEQHAVKKSSDGSVAEESSSSAGAAASPGSADAPVHTKAGGTAAVINVAKPGCVSSRFSLFFQLFLAKKLLALK